MRRQLPPSHLKVPPGPHAFPRQHFLGQDTVVVNHYSGIEKAIPAIPSLPGFRTSAGMFGFILFSPGVLMVVCSVAATGVVMSTMQRLRRARFLGMNTS